jgi:hypothetical protein
LCGRFTWLQKRFGDLGSYTEFLLEINLKILLRKPGARLIFKIALIYLHIDPRLIYRETRLILKFRLAPIFVSKISILILARTKH